MKKIVLIAAVLFMGTNLNSQKRTEFHIGLSSPMGEFKADDIEDEDESGASVGFNMGLSHTFPITESGLGIFLGLDLIYNTQSKDYKDDIEEDLGKNDDYTFSKYINIPLSVGLNYGVNVNEKINLYGKAGLTLNYFKMTDFVWEEDGDDDWILSFESATSIGDFYGFSK